MAGLDPAIPGSTVLVGVAGSSPAMTLRDTRWPGQLGHDVEGHGVGSALTFTLPPGTVRP